jgi:glutaredoxin
VSITVYVTSWCPHCKRARRWLERNGIAHTVLDVGKSDAAKRAMRKVNPRGGVPTFVVDGRVMVGFSPSGLRRVIGQAAARRQSAGSGSAW